ncbi:hypothetical protein [uncultured Intestinimonas sp.]|nr:hypothetical protein [uncultured Intestinimonas sp.]
MKKVRPPKKCSSCGQESVYVRDFCVKDDMTWGIEIFDAALYRCPACGHFDFFEREEDREARLQEAQRAEERRKYYESLPDYFCPKCRKVRKSERCPSCGMGCFPIQKRPEQREGPEEAPAPEPVQPEKKKKRRWFGRDPDKPDWEG